VVNPVKSFHISSTKLQHMFFFPSDFFKAPKERACHKHGCHLPLIILLSLALALLIHNSGIMNFNFMPPNYRAPTNCRIFCFPEDFFFLSSSSRHSLLASYLALALSLNNKQRSDRTGKGYPVDIPHHTTFHYLFLLPSIPSLTLSCF